MVDRRSCRRAPRRAAGVAALLAATILLAPTGSTRADETSVEDQLARMEARLIQVEQRLTATADQLDAAEQRVRSQEQRLAEAGLAAEGAPPGGLAAFASSLRLGGWISASWNYNFNGVDGSFLAGGNAGAVPAYPFKADSNSFQLDQLWFALEREVDESQRAGFRIDLAYGKTAGLLSGLSPRDGLSGNDFELNQAYAQYLAPVGSASCSESESSPRSSAPRSRSPPRTSTSAGARSITSSQPASHTGLFASTEAGGFELGFGVVNETRSFPAADIDRNNGKALLWSLGYGVGDFGLSFAGTWGEADSAAGRDVPAGNRDLILDWVVSWEPSDRLSVYANIDVLRSDRPGPDDADGVGVSLAGRYQLGAATGLALRGEYVELDNHPAAGRGGTPGDLALWGATVTVDHLLGEALMLRGELRYDLADGDGRDELFADGDRPLGNDDQVVGLLEVIYKFDGFAR